MRSNGRGTMTRTILGNRRVGSTSKWPLLLIRAILTSASLFFFRRDCPELVQEYWAGNPNKPDNLPNAKKRKHDDSDASDTSPVEERFGLAFEEEDLLPRMRKEGYRVARHSPFPTNLTDWNLELRAIHTVQRIKRTDQLVAYVSWYILNTRWREFSLATPPHTHTHLLAELFHSYGYFYHDVGRTEKRRSTAWRSCTRNARIRYVSVQRAAWRA